MLRWQFYCCLGCIGHSVIMTSAHECKIGFTVSHLNDHFMRFETVQPFTLLDRCLFSRANRKPCTLSRSQSLVDTVAMRNQEALVWCVSLGTVKERTNVTNIFFVTIVKATKHSASNGTNTTLLPNQPTERVWASFRALLSVCSLGEHYDQNSVVCHHILRSFLCDGCLTGVEH